jgi:class 3 adenylate cyclase/tetratricopeptide (TPR) repeat protein
MECSRCRFDNPDDFRFCGRCGASLDACRPRDTEPLNQHLGQRPVTILFCDLCEYSKLAEAVDPEEVRAILNQIYSVCARIVRNYAGRVERFIGDEIMALFSSPVAQEDDAVRAIHAARKIHRAVDKLDAHLRSRIGHPLVMHSGIDTGRVATGESPQYPFCYSVTGDAVISAKDLQRLAKPGEIIVSPETHGQASSSFTFQSFEYQPGNDPHQVATAYKMLAQDPAPRKIDCCLGRQARLIAREKELSLLVKAAANLKKGDGEVIWIGGDMGIGKSRLVDEFKSSLDLADFGWYEGNAYEFTDNISYFPFIDLLRRQFKIFEQDPPQKIREKIADAICRGPEANEVAACIERLFALDHDRLPMEPESLKARLQRAVSLHFSTLAKARPTIICLKDLHWSDPSSIELLQAILANIDYPVLFLLVFRTPLTPVRLNVVAFGQVPSTVIRLKELSADDTRKMACSLLQISKLPDDLQSFIDANMDGHPLYLEETINSLIESETLVASNGSWELTGRIHKSQIALTIQGILTSRLDRLKPGVKQLIEEASVIGVSFPSDILLMITRTGDRMQVSLDELEQLDLIRLKSESPTLGYSFKHGLIRDVVYNGLLKTVRQALHERIGLAMEKMFAEHLPAHYESLAFHFKMAAMIPKAIEYLMHSGRKSLRCYAVEESHQYYQDAYKLLVGLNSRSARENQLLIQTLADWAPVFYYRGRFDGIEVLMNKHLKLAESLDDKPLQGMYFVGCAMNLWAREKFRASYRFLHRALAFGRESKNEQVQGYAHFWLPWICTELGLFEEARHHAKRAKDLESCFNSVHYPNHRSLDCEGFIYCAAGDSLKCKELGKALLDFGLESNSKRAITWGYCLTGWGHLVSGNFAAAVQTSKQATNASGDPFYTLFPKLFLGMSHVLMGNHEAAKPALLEVADHGRRYGGEVIGNLAEFLLSLVTISEGHLRKGITQVQRLSRRWEKIGACQRRIHAEVALGEIYQALIRREAKLPFIACLRNLGFLIRTLPFAGKKAETHYLKAAELATQIDSKGMLGQAYFGLGRLYRFRGMHQKAMESIDRAIGIFQACHAEDFLHLAEELKNEDRKGRS